jgi:hypothetical protein
MRGDKRPVAPENSATHGPPDILSLQVWIQRIPQTVTKQVKA